LVTQETRDAIASATTRFVRTTRHPSAALVGDATSFDDEYERHDTFAEVYAAIATRVSEAALRDGSALYAVPGSPGVLEDVVQRLLADTRLDVRVMSAVSFLDLAWLRLGIDPVNHSVRLVDAHRFAEVAADDRGPFLVAQCHADWVLSEVKLAHDSARGDEPVVVLHHLGLPDEQVVTTTWDDIDRLERAHGVVADHLTSIYIAQLAEPIASEMARLHRLARTLREQCPWDREQTHASLVRYLIEETYEVVDALNALDANDPTTDDALIEELGDLLYQIEFHAAIAEQEGRFTMGDVARGIHEKLVRRHPHVFAPNENSAVGSDALVKSWDDIKKAEKAAKGIVAGPFDGIPQATGSLAYASAILKRANKAGVPIELPSPGAHELGDIADLGMHLLEVVAECRRRGVDPEVALRKVSNIQRQNAERHTDA
jgi:tetrapyrrole methylase family protein/MazG family protein